MPACDAGAEAICADGAASRDSWARKPKGTQMGTWLCNSRLENSTLWLFCSAVRGRFRSNLSARAGGGYRYKIRWPKPYWPDSGHVQTVAIAVVCSASCAHTRDTQAELTVWTVDVRYSPLLALPSW